MEPTELWSLLDKGGTIACLFAFAIGGMKQWWVYGHHYRDVIRERDEWKGLALRGHTINRQAVQAVDTLASTVKP